MVVLVVVLSGRRLTGYQEIKPDMVESLKAKQSLKAAELQDGDIICFQRTADRRTGTPNFLEKRLGGEGRASDVA